MKAYTVGLCLLALLMGPGGTHARAIRQLKMEDAHATTAHAEVAPDAKDLEHISGLIGTWEGSCVQNAATHTEDETPECIAAAHPVATYPIRFVYEADAHGDVHYSFQQWGAPAANGTMHIETYSAGGHVLDVVPNEDGSLCVTILDDDNTTVSAQTVLVTGAGGPNSYYTEVGLYTLSDDEPLPVCLTQIGQQAICNDNAYVYKCTATKITEPDYKAVLGEWEGSCSQAAAMVGDSLTCIEDILTYPITFSFREGPDGTLLYSFAQPSVSLTVGNATYTYSAFEVIDSVVTGAEWSTSGAACLDVVDEDGAPSSMRVRIGFNGLQAVYSEEGGYDLATDTALSGACTTVPDLPLGCDTQYNYRCTATRKPAATDGDRRSL